MAHGPLSLPLSEALLEQEFIYNLTDERWLVELSLDEFCKSMLPETWNDFSES